MRLLTLILFLPVLVFPQSDREDIETVLRDQVEAWNRGDVEEYMKGYWRSDETKFVSGGNVVMGFDSVLGRYQRTYGTREKMGSLSFDDLEVKVLDGGNALVTGRWKLRRATDAPWGRFTLVLRKFRDGWRIVYDHTSSGQ
jgi:ketosteroid isomerase-like protein